MNVKNEIKRMTIRSGMTMQEAVELLSREYGWSESVSNFSNKLARCSLRYQEALEIADVTFSAHKVTCCRSQPCYPKEEIAY